MALAVTDGSSQLTHRRSAVPSPRAGPRTSSRLLQMSPRLVASLIFLTLVGPSTGACRRERPAPVVLTVARGAEPFWSVEVRSDRTQFSRLGVDSVVYPYAPPDFDADGRAVYRAKRFGVDPLLTLVIERGDCSDGMSNQRFPGRAVLTRGDSTWRGCATVVPDSPGEQ
jgi:uncharacterized membrane protein